ncbi:50S ribosomal protein L21 [Candidatus Peribacteria bacterium]|nr:50S ribosomal protein L21 [Candidatus Peribacteria bacterium]
MIAVAHIGGHQAIVQVGDVLEVDRLAFAPGDTVTFEVMLLSEPDGKGFTAGQPVVAGAGVVAEVQEHTRGDKIRVYKMQKRKRYRKTLGHRSEYTVVVVKEIKTSGATPDFSSFGEAPAKPAKKPAVATVTPAAVASEKPVVQSTPKAASKGDDLTRIEGVGPKIADLLTAAGYETYASVSAATVADLQAVLDEAGPRYSVHSPATWPEQAALAAAGDFSALTALQEQLKGGKEAA